MSDKTVNEFEGCCGAGSINTLSEFWYFLRQNKKWWPLPILVSLVLFGAFMTLSGTAFALFIYTFSF